MLFPRHLLLAESRIVVFGLIYSLMMCNYLEWFISFLSFHSPKHILFDPVYGLIVCSQGQAASGELSSAVLLMCCKSSCAGRL